MSEEMRAWADRVHAHARAKGMPLATMADILAAARDYTETDERLTLMVLNRRWGRPTGDGGRLVTGQLEGDLIVDWLADTTYHEIRKEART